MTASLKSKSVTTTTGENGGGYQLPEFPYFRPAELNPEAQSVKHPVVVVGGGLAGLTMACDLASRGIKVVLLDDDNTVGVRGASSRGICYAQKSLEIFRRLGVYQRIADKGIQWSVGKTLAGNQVVYEFDLRKQASHSVSAQPAFINLQQFYLEWFLVDRLMQLPNAEIRWLSKVTQVSQTDDHVELGVQCPDGRYQLLAQWVVDATGLRSPIRDGFGLKTNPADGEDRWCISDVRFKHRPPIERWTWVEAPFNQNRAVWQHLMADDVWRLDYQMAPDSDPEYISRPEVVHERLQAQFGQDIEYELIWVGPYGYRSHVLEQMRLGRVFFIGDSAHVMSPFGARGGNSAIQDADNLGWKLAQVLRGEAAEPLLDSFHHERHRAAQLNVQITQRTMRFLTPKTAMQRTFRDAVIELAKRYPFARTLVNTGRLSTPTPYGEGLSGKLCNSVSMTQFPIGQSVGNAILFDSTSKQTDLIELIAHKPNAYLLLTQSPSRAAQLQVELADCPGVQVCAVVTEGAVPGGWTEPTGFLASIIGRTNESIAVFRPDLHFAGHFPVEGLRPALEATFFLQFGKGRES